MNIFVKSIKNVFAKKVFLPLFFATLAILCFVLPINFAKASQITTNENNNQTPKISSVDVNNFNADNLPEEFTLISVENVIKNFLPENKNNTANLPSNVGAQMGTSICWAFASLTALETTLYKQGVANVNENLNFSELNLAYTTQVINRNLQNVAGGNFDLAYEYLSSENGAVYQQNGEGYNPANQSRWASDSSVTPYYAENFYATATQSNYRVLEAVSFPDKNTLSTEEEKQNLRQAIKHHIQNYGGVTASIYMDTQNLVNNQFYICTNKNLKQNHMVTLVGWDDNFTQKIGGVTYTGAYIVQNSAGSNWGMGGYFYVMYEDAFVENDVNGFLRVGEELEDYISYNNMKGTSHNNKFLTFKTNTSGGGDTSYNIKTITENFYITNIYKTEEVSNQYISRLKIPTSYNNKQTQFKVYVLNGLQASDVQSLNSINQFYKNNVSSAIQIENKYSTEDPYLFTSNQATYYTIELNQNVYVTSGYFAIIVEYISGSVPQLSNDDNTLSSPYLFTYKSSNMLEWSSYYALDNSFSILPMIVQMQYDLGEIDYTCNNIQKEYDGEQANINISVSTNCNYKILYSLTEDGNFTQTIPTIKNSGNYIVYFKIVADYFTTIKDSITIEIIKKDVTITPISNQSKTYGEGDQVLSYEVSGSVEQAFIRGRLARIEGEDVGRYQILQGSLELYTNQNFDKNNYNLVFNSNPVYFNIIPRNLYITPILTTKIYADNDPAQFTYSYSNLAVGEIPAFSGVLGRETGENVGSYSVTLNSLTLQNNLAQTQTQKNFFATNYNLVLQNAQDKFKITKRNLVITPTANQSKVFGEQDPTFSFSYSNNALGEIPNFSGSLTRILGEDAGNYNYLLGTLEIVSTGTLQSGNYNLALNAENVYFAITYGVLNGCSVEDIETNYDATYYFVTPKNNLHNDVSFSFSLDGLTWQAENIKIKNAGTHSVYVKFSKENYADNIILSTIKINALNLVITPNANQSKIYGEIDKPLTFSYSGNLLSETPLFSGELSRELDFSFPTNERVGEYQINKGNLKLEDNENFIAGNYNLVFNLDDAIFSITPRQLLISPNANQYKYYNTQDVILNYSYSNVVVGETPLLTGELSREVGEDVGDYTILLGSLAMQQNGNFLPENYSLIVLNNCFYKIIPAEITIVINNKQGYYGQEVNTNFTYKVVNNSNFTGSYNNNDDLNLSFNCSVTSNSLKGVYPITCNYNNNNYKITVQNGEYEILYNFYTVQFTAYNQPIFSITVEHFYTLKDSDFPQLPYKSGYKFNCWLVMSSNGTFSVVSGGYTVTAYTTIVAMVETVNYTITYNTNGGNFNPVISNYNVETPTFVLNSPTKQGYTFEGWYTNPNLLGESVTKVENGSTGNKIFYAKYSINTYQISFSKDANLPYSFIYEGSTSIKYSSNFKFSVLLKTEYSQSYSKMKVYAKLLGDEPLHTNQNNLLQNISKTQQMEQNPQQETLFLLTPNNKGYYTIDNVLGNYEIYCENITLNSYSIFFLIDNNLVKQTKKNHGEALNAYEYPLIPEKEHYKNTAPYWETESIAEVTKNEVISAKYVPDVHIVTFMLPNGKLVKTNVNYNETVSTSILEKSYPLGIFNYYVFETSLDNITEDTIIKVRIGSNAYILYIALVLVTVLVIVIVTVTLVKKRKKDTFNWWVYTKRK